jgi:hypothetical protein
VLDAFKDADPERILKKHRQLSLSTVHNETLLHWLMITETDNPEGQVTYLCLSAQTAGLPTSSSIPQAVHIAFLFCDYIQRIAARHICSHIITICNKYLLHGFLKLAQFFPVFTFPNPPEVFHTTVNSTSPT